MTADLSTVIGVALSAAGALIGATAWVTRTVVLDRITKLEDSRDGMGKRFGDGQADTKLWQACHDAVELYKQGRWPR